LTAEGRSTKPVLAVFVALAGAASAASAQDLEVDGVGYVLGHDSAPVEVVEFGDFACSACAEFWRDTWPAVRTELIETGRVRWRHVPFLLGFDRGDDATNAAECAAEQGAFWTMHDRLFEGQREWARGRGHHDVLRRYAAEEGLDVEEFRECYDDERGEHRTDAANRAARHAAIRGTPTFFVEGTPVLGAVTFEALEAVVQEAEQSVPR
jgi:protein-disulfide isomerase